MKTSGKIDDLKKSGSWNGGGMHLVVPPKNFVTLYPNKPIKSWRKNKKFAVLASDGKLYVLIHFGDTRYEDFTQHKDKKRRENYLKRSAGIRDGNGKLTANNIFSPNYWSRKYLW